MNVSVVILTYNEEVNIERCLSSLKGFQDIHIVDSGSVDETLTLAKSFNVRIHQNPFISFSNQRNFAHEYCDLKYDWVLHLDADEEMTDELEQEIQACSNNNIELDCFNISSKLIFFGRFLRYSAGFPNYQVRLLRKHIKFHDVGHGQKEICDITKIGLFTASYLHYNFSQGIQSWLTRHVSYAKKEADLIWIHRKNGYKNLKKIRNFNRENIKLLYSFCPLFLRPIIKFLFLYVMKGGFRDGKIGLYFCLLQLAYEAMIYIFYIEKRFNFNHESQTSK